MMADEEEVAAANEGGAEDDDGDGGQLSSITIQWVQGGWGLFNIAKLSYL